MSRLYEMFRQFNPNLRDENPVRVGVRTLARQMPEVLSQLRKSNSVGVLTFRGEPHFFIIPIDPYQLPALALASSPHQFEDDMRTADDSLDIDLKNEGASRTATAS